MFMYKVYSSCSILRMVPTDRGIFLLFPKPSKRAYSLDRPAECYTWMPDQSVKYFTNGPSIPKKIYGPPIPALFCPTSGPFFLNNLGPTVPFLMTFSQNSLNKKISTKILKVI